MKRVGFRGAIVFGFLFAASANGSWQSVTTPAAIELEGGFAKGAVHPKTRWEDRRMALLPFYGNFQNFHGTAGAFRTTEFRLARQVRCYLVAFPSAPGTEIYLLDVHTQQRLPLKSTLPTYRTFRERIWTIPLDWRGRTVRFVAQTQQQASPDSWFALTIPETGEAPSWLPFARAAYRAFFLAFYFAWFLVPGAAVASCFAYSSQWKLAALTLISSATVAYTVLWVFVLNSKSGPIACLFVFFASAGLLLRFKRRVNYGRDLRLLAGAVILLAIFYNSLCFLYYTDDGPGEIAQMRFGPNQMPPDNQLQNTFAQRLADGETVRPFMMANAHASDRPPLETAIVLEQRPLWNFLNTDNYYHVLSVSLQCLWMASVGILLTQMQVHKQSIVCTIAFTAFTLFAWQNSVYVWPKLLAASFCLIGMSAVPCVRGERRPWTISETLLATFAFTLSLLSHSGSGFTILAVLGFVMARRAVPPWRYCTIAIVAALLLVLPWRAYQVFVDPPGDTLFKLHLAGSSDPNGSLLTALANGYGKLTPATYASAKLANLKVLFFAPAWQPFHDFPSFLRDLTAISFFSFFPCAGLLNLGLLARLRLSREMPGVRAADRLLLLAALSLTIWCLLMFEPGSTYVHQGSYATVLLYFAAMAIYLTAWSRKLMWALIAVQACAVFPWFVTVQPVFSQSNDFVWNNSLDWGMMTSAFTSLVLLAGCAAAYMASDRTVDVTLNVSPER